MSPVLAQNGRPMKTLQLPADPAEALVALRDASRESDVVVFKKSPICPVSTRAEFEFRSWLKALDGEAALAVAEVDVIAERGLARGLTAALDIKHESPQALWLRDGELLWHDSHGALTRDRFASSMPSRS